MTSNIWYRRTGVPVPWDRWRTPSIRSSPSVWRRPELGIERNRVPEALVWTQRQPYKKKHRDAFGIDQNCLPTTYNVPVGRQSVPHQTLHSRSAPQVAALGPKRTFDNALAGAVLGFPFRRRNRPVPGGRRRDGRADLAFFQGSAGVFAASGL